MYSYYNINMILFNNNHLFAHSFMENKCRVFTIDFDGMSTRLQLFYVKRLGNPVYCTLIITFVY